MIRYIPPQQKLIATPRKYDDWGGGHFGAPRGKRTHAGVDYACPPNSTILSLSPGTVANIGYPYANGVGAWNDPDEPYRYVEIEQTNRYRIRYAYVQPTVGVGEEICVDTPLGTSQAISRRYPNITEHVHIEVYDPQGTIIDPEEYINA